MADRAHHHGRNLAAIAAAAAALVAGFVWIVDDFQIERLLWLRYLACGLTLFAGITMVTSVPFYSFKDINFRRSVPFWAVLIIVLAGGGFYFLNARHERQVAELKKQAAIADAAAKRAHAGDQCRSSACRRRSTRRRPSRPCTIRTS